MSTGPGRTPGFSMMCLESDELHWDCVDIPLEPALLLRRERDGALIALSEAGARALADPLVDTAFKRLLALGHDVRIFPNADGESVRFAFNELAEGPTAQLAAERALTLVCTLRDAATELRRRATIAATSYRASAVDPDREAAVAAEDDAAGRRAHADYVLGWAARLRNKIFGHKR